MSSLSGLKFKENPTWNLYSNEFAFLGVIYKIDENGFWSIGSTLYWGKPWVDNDKHSKQSKLCGATIDKKFKEEIEKLNSSEQQMANLRWLDSMSNDESVSMYSFPGRAHVVRTVKPCSHITYAGRAKGHVCSECCTYHIDEPGEPIVLRTSGK